MDKVFKTNVWSVSRLILLIYLSLLKIAFSTSKCKTNIWNSIDLFSLHIHRCARDKFNGFFPTNFHRTVRRTQRSRRRQSWKIIYLSMWFPYVNILGPSEGPSGPVAANSGKHVCDFLMQISSYHHLERFEVQNVPKATTNWFYACVMENVFKTNDWAVLRLRILVSRCKKLIFNFEVKTICVFSGEQKHRFA